jgi:GntR family transcriptional regulator, transcriptional repressor for pyruvate dehydrogenase complex
MIEFTSLVDKIAGELHSQVLQGKLVPGERLPAERSLCVTFGVGRTTIREALKSLVVRGLISRKGRGVIVADPAHSSPPGVDLSGLAAQVTIKQLYEVRKLLEVKIAGWAAMRATASDVEAIQQSLSSEPSRSSNTGSANRIFHDALATAAHNPALQRVYQSGSELFFRLPFFWKLFDDVKVRAVRARRHDMAHRWHQQILTAITEHDVSEAEGAMFQHLDIMEKDLLSRLSVHDDRAGEEGLYNHPILAESARTEPETSTARHLIR